MRAFIMALVMALLLPSFAPGSPQQQADMKLAWAFPSPDKVPPAVIDDTPLKQVPGSTKVYDRPQIDPFSPPDWFPDEHPPMPPVVQHGSGEAVQACSYCHLASGCGHPQSANLAGLPVTYLMRQIADFKSGARTAPPMDSIAKALLDDDAQQASGWFASLKPRPWVKVVETDTAPRTFVIMTRLRLPLPDGGNEPLGNRIIEVPEEPSRALSYDPHSGFIAYVPLGSIAKGEKLVTTGGGGKTIACVTCHGETLRGMGDVPRIAGRSAIYIVRQLYTIQAGTRAGAAAELMKPVVMNLNPDDMVAIAAYIASRTP
jgi:cytochrome c553